MKKVRTTINLNEDVVRKAKSLKINISAVAEMSIINYIKELENIESKNKYSVNEKTNNDNPYSKPYKSNSGAYGLEVMTLPSHGRGRRFKSG